jgi:cell division transport system permease protein
MITHHDKKLSGNLLRFRAPLKHMISDIVYDKQLVNLVNDNIKSKYVDFNHQRFLCCAVLLINSSLRLSIHSNRFIIKTMQMVGATKSFIRKPFRSIKLG